MRKWRAASQLAGNKGYAVRLRSRLHVHRTDETAFFPQRILVMLLITVVTILRLNIFPHKDSVLAARISNCPLQRTQTFCRNSFLMADVSSTWRFARLIDNLESNCSVRLI